METVAWTVSTLAVHCVRFGTISCWNSGALYLTYCMASFGLVALFVFETNSRPNNGSDDASGSSACQSGLRGS